MMASSTQRDSMERSFQEAEEAMKIDSKFEVLVKGHLNIDRALNPLQRAGDLESNMFIKHNESSIMPSYMSTQRTEQRGHNRSKDNTSPTRKAEDKKMNVKKLTSSQRDLLNLVSSISKSQRSHEADNGSQ
mmetsp:Transcript_21990/g.34138  ORF Transcript_21990/g.34138 Transcript_21990/m.34138 type:complete len:131 (+) Transcript_21990:1212-1604(+)